MKFLASPFFWLWRLVTGDGVKKALSTVDALIVDALPIVKQIASLTPTRADDEMIRLFETFGQPAIEKWLALPPAQRGKALLSVGEAELQKAYPDLPLNQISAAVAFAVTLMKNQPPKL